MVEYTGKSFSFSKQNWDSFVSEPLSGYSYNRVLFALAQLKPNFYPAPNPQIPQAVPLRTACPRQTPGYPAPPCPGGDYSPEPLSGQTPIGKFYIYIKAIWDSFSSEPLSGRESIGKTFPLQRSIFGNVLTGYLKLSDGTVIKDGFRVIIKNSYGFVLWGKCYSTGVYQIVLDQQRYDNSLLIVENVIFELYDQYGTFYIDGYITQLEPKDMFFSPKPASVVPLKIIVKKYKGVFLPSGIEI